MDWVRASFDCRSRRRAWSQREASSRPRAARLFGALFAISLGIALTPIRAGAQGGSLDSTFGGDGRITTDFTSGKDRAHDVALQPSDGKLVAVGLAGGAGGRFALARYNTDGSLDSTFGSDGKVATNLTSQRDEILAAIIQPSDEKIVVAGRASGNLALARYNADGTLDDTFGGDGKVTTSFSRGSDFAWDVVLQPSDGKIVVGGGANWSGRDPRALLARYNSDGTLDPTFSGDGRVTANYTGGSDYIDDVEVQASDGTIVTGGSANYFGHASLAINRYDADGTPDSTFGGDGAITTAFAGVRSWCFALALQPSDGKIVAAGQAGGAQAVARYNTDGSLDSTFSGDGRATTNFTRGTDYADEIAIQGGDEKIVTAGSANYYGPDARFALARYGTGGSLDGSFGGDGKVTTNFTPTLDRGFGIAEQPSDGALVVAGGAGGRGGRFALARYVST